ncbi:MAG: BamA/TamA family outer membrane protein [Bacteroidota bacterium]
MMTLPVLVLLLTLAGCTGLGKISEGEYLFTGGDVSYRDKAGLSDKQEIDNQLNGLIMPEPNTKLLWMRPFLAIHNMVGETDKEKGLKYWLKYKLGKPPVLLSDVKPDDISDAMVNRLENQGHFNATTEYEIKRDKKTADIEFEIDAGTYYTIRSLRFPGSANRLLRLINESSEKSLIDTGMHYDLDKLSRERDRIDKILKNKGYFYFAPNYLIFTADTLVGNHQVNMDLDVKADIPSDAEVAYRLNKIYIHDDYSLRDYNPDTTRVDNYYYLTDNNYFDPQTVVEAVFLYQDSLYERRNHYNTLRHLMGLGIYKFANARFSKADSAGLMNVSLLLTPYKKMSVSAETNYALGTNNFAGPGLKLSFKNRNIFRGAELLSINLGGRFETQYSGKNKGQTSYEITLDASLSIPRFVPIRFQRNVSKEFVPSTVITIGGGLYSRMKLYELRSFNSSLTYNWRNTDRISQQFSPLDVSYTALAKTSDEFEDYLDSNPIIRRSFEEQFILGNSYTFTYSTLHLTQKHARVLVSPSIDASGNAAYLLSTIGGSDPTPENPEKLLDVPFAQYVRIRNEIRYFYDLSPSTVLASRLITASGFPYGNSSTMPYIKQYFVGGTNSVRAFSSRTVGPGTYAPPDTVDNVFLDQTGDIKLEASLEYRFDIYRFVKGAFFADAGNIWLNNADDNRPGGKFNFDTFYKELAVGTGFGIRFDFDFVVVRFDLAFPVRKPYLSAGDRWVFDEIAIGSSSWRRENLILNIAIGYPF